MSKTKNVGSGALTRVRKYFPNVTTVVDATKSITVEVTKRDEATSTRKAHKSCAMAVACKRAMHLDGVIVSVKTAYLIKDGTATRYSLPESVSREVVSFDRGGGFEPGDYKMDKPRHELGQQGGHTRHVGRSSRRTHVMTKNIRSVLGSEVE